MKKLANLRVSTKYGSKTIEFGIPQTKKELLDMHKVRQNVYSEKGYFSEQQKSESYDIDDYDTRYECLYLIAKIGEKTIGSVRLIFGSPLPTQTLFDFHDSLNKYKIGPEERAEISRLVISREIKDEGIPRNITLLFFFKILIDYAKNNNVSGGYVYLKRGIRRKLRLLKIPIHFLRKYKPKYKKRGPMEGYFNNRADKVIPGYYIVDEVKPVIDSIFNNLLFFSHTKEGTYTLRRTIYNWFLRKMGIL